MDYFYEHEANGIYTRHIREESADGSGYSMHIHDRCEIYYFIDGKANYLVEGTEYKMKRGSLLIMRPGEVHRAKLLQNGIYERYAVNFPISLFDDIDPERRLMRLYTDRSLGKNNLYERPEFEGLFEQLCSDFIDDYDRRIVANRVLLEIFLGLGEEFRDEKSEDSVQKGLRNRTSRKILKYVNSHIFEDLSADKLSEKFYLSKSQIGRIFKQATGASPWEYVTAKRLVAAREMINEGVSAKETAEKCGFGDYSSFYRAYVKRYNESPAAQKRM